MAEPLVSVFTPSHDTRYLESSYSSLLGQTYSNWEWVIALNGDAQDPAYPDPRVRAVRVGEVTGVGQAKRRAVEACEGSILLELDHDDWLHSRALDLAVRAFEEHPEASLVYSNFTEVDAGGRARDQRFDPTQGWTYHYEGSDVTGTWFLVPNQMDPTPHNVSLIWFAPNHFRAFSRYAYDQTSGYREDLPVLDDLALMGELYQQGEFVPIDKLLYYQRIHGNNTQLDQAKNQLIQTGTWDLYEQNLVRNLEAWGRREGLEWADPTLPPVYEENRLAYIRRYNNLNAHQEWFTMDLFEELVFDYWMRLAPNGMLLLMDKVSGSLNEDYFRTWCETVSDTRKGLPYFQESRLRTFRHNDEWWFQANLIAVKDGYTREGGPLWTLSCGR